MEYEGAGSFWSQLTVAQEESGPVIISRKIDELLRDSTSSIYDIISDDEAISEFRSGNDKIVARLSAADGIDALVKLVTFTDLPESIGEAQKQQLPFIASELIACENETLLEAFTRVIPGQRNALDRLFDYIILCDDMNPTILGYTVRVLLVLVNRRVNVVDKYLNDHQDAIQEGLLDHLSDRSIADLIFRLCLDDGTKSFRMNYADLFGRIDEHNSHNILWLVDSMFGKPLLGNNEQVIANFHFMKDDLLRNGLPLLISKAFNGTSSVSSTSALDILSTIIFYGFTRPAVSESGLVESSGWETFAPSSPGKKAVAPMPASIDDDSCVFDDEMNSPKSISGTALTPFTELGSILIQECVTHFNSSFVSIESLAIHHVHAFIRLMSRCVAYQTKSTLWPSVIGDVVVKSMRRFPRSSAIHNLCRDCIVNDNVVGQSLYYEELARLFTPFAVEQLEQHPDGSSNSHIMSILAFLDTKIAPSTSLGVIAGEKMDVVSTGVKRWSEINTRLVDRQDKIPTRVPSPHGVTPIVDLEVSSQWVNMDFASVSFPVTDHSGDESLSPQVKFDETEESLPISPSSDDEI